MNDWYLANSSPKQFFNMQTTKVKNNRRVKEKRGLIGTKSNRERKAFGNEETKIDKLKMMHMNIINEFAKNCEFDVRNQEFKISKPLFDKMSQKLNRVELGLNRYMIKMMVLLLLIFWINFTI